MKSIENLMTVENGWPYQSSIVDWNSNQDKSLGLGFAQQGKQDH